jgi:hypothetical protein
MITERQEQIENGIEVLDHAIDFLATKTKEKMILVDPDEVYLADFMEDATLKRGLFYRGQRVTTAGCPSPAQNRLWEKEWVRPVSDMPPVAFDVADILAIRIMARLCDELQTEFNDVTVKSQNNS